MSNKNRNILIGIVTGVLVLLCCCVILIAAVVLIDPYGVIGRISGTYDPIADVLPEETTIYAYTDLNSLMNNMEEIENLINTFDVEDEFDEDLQDLFFEQFEDETGMNFEEDVQSWIGQYLGFAIPEINYEELDYGLEPGIIIAAEIRPFKNGQADEFLQLLMDVFAEDMEYSFDEEEIDGVKVYIGEFPYDDMQIILARYNNLLIGSNSLDAVEDLIKGETQLSDSDSYKKAIKALPNDRMMTFYLDGTSIFEQMGPIYDELYYELGIDFEMSDIDFSYGMAYSFTMDDGDPRMDIAISFDPEAMDETYQMDMYTTDIDVENLAGFYPDDTWLFMASNMDLSQINDILDAYESLLAEELGDLDGMLDEVNAELGFDLIDDFLVHFKGNFMLGIYDYQSSESVPVGFSLYIETSEIDEIKDRVENIALLAGEMEYIDHYENDGLDVYQMEDYYGDVAGAFGTYEEYFVIGMSADSIEDGLNSSHPLSEYEDFLAVREKLPRKLSAYFHMDVGAILELSYSSMYYDEIDSETEYLIDKIGALGFGMYAESDDVVVGTIILDIKE